MYSIYIYILRDIHTFVLWYCHPVWCAVLRARCFWLLSLPHFPHDSWVCCMFFWAPCKLSHWSLMSCSWFQEDQYSKRYKPRSQVRFVNPSSRWCVWNPALSPRRGTFQNWFAQRHCTERSRFVCPYFGEDSQASLVETPPLNSLSCGLWLWRLWVKVGYPHNWPAHARTCSVSIVVCESMTSAEPMFFVFSEHDLIKFNYTVYNYVELVNQVGMNITYP